MSTARRGQSQWIRETSERDKANINFPPVRTFADMSPEEIERIRRETKPPDGQKEKKNAPPKAWRLKGRNW